MDTKFKKKAVALSIIFACLIIGYFYRISTNDSFARNENTMQSTKDIKINHTFFDYRFEKFTDKEKRFNLSFVAIRLGRGKKEISKSNISNTFVWRKTAPLCF